MKKMILFSALLLLIASFAGAITVWFSWEGENQFKNMVNEFNKANPQNKVNFVYVPDMLQKLQITLSSHGILPDVALVRSDDIGLLASSEAVIPVSPSNTTESFKKAFTYDSRMYAYPYYADVQVVYMNANVYKGALPGNDWTVSDLEKMISEVKKDGHDGIAFDKTSSYLFNSFNAAFNGGTIPQKDGIPNVNNENTMKAFEFYNMLFNEKKYAVSYHKMALMNSFKTGKVAFMFQGSFMIPDFLKAGMNFRVLPYPTLDNGQPIPPAFDAKGFVVFKESPAAKKFIDYVTSTKNEIGFCSATYKLPANPDAIKALENPESFSNLITTATTTPYSVDNLKASLETMDIDAQRALILPTSAVFKEVYSNAITTALGLYLNGKMTLKEALKKAQEYIDGNK